MSEIEYTVLATEIIQGAPEDYTVDRIHGNIARQRTRTMLKMSVFVSGGTLGGEVLEYEAPIPAMMMTRRHATIDEVELALELREVDRRHQERLERRRLGPR